VLFQIGRLITDFYRACARLSPTDPKNPPGLYSDKDTNNKLAR
jgi:hypothetical protein